MNFKHFLWVPLLFVFSFLNAQTHFLKYETAYYEALGENLLSRDSVYYSFGSNSLTENMTFSRIDSGGNVLWCKQYGGTNEDQASSFIQLKDGNFILLGESKSYSKGGKDILVIKVDSIGAIIWSKSFGGTGNEYDPKIYENSDSSLIIGASTESYGSRRAYVIKLNAAGELMWSKTYGAHYTHNYDNILRIDDNRYMLYGSAYEPISKGSQIYAMMLDANGNVRWSKFYGESGNDNCKGAFLSSQNDIILFGKTDAYNNSSFQMFLMAIDTLGETSWMSIYTSGPDLEPVRIIQNNQNDLYVCGNWYNTANSKRKGFIIRTDSNANLAWSRIYGDTSSDISRIGFSHDNQLLFSGFNIRGNFGAYFLAKTNLSGTNACFDSDFLELEQFWVSPPTWSMNPFINVQSDSATRVVSVSSFVPQTYSTCTKSCNVQSDFHTSTNRTCPGLAVKFTNYSQGSQQATWYVDGQSYQTFDLNYTFSTPGIYEVKLVTAGNLCDDTARTYIRVDSSLVASIDYTQNLKVVDFKSTIRNAKACRWDFGDGESSTHPNPTHAYKSFGTYQACFSSFNSCDTLIQCVTIAVDDTANIRFVKVHDVIPGVSTQQWPSEIISTADGGFLVTGIDRVSGNTGDVLFSKFNAKGEAVWSRAIRNNGGGKGKSIYQCKNLDILIGGSSNGYAYYLKMDRLGSSTWSRGFKKGSSNAEINQLIQTSDGSYIGTGTSVSSFLVFKLDFAGNMCWLKSYPGGRVGLKIIETKAHDYVVMGNSKLSGHTYAVKLDTSGQVIWSENISGIVANSVVETMDDSYLFAGNGMTLLKLNSNGSVRWAKTYSTTSATALNNAFEDSSGLLYLTAGGTNSKAQLICTDSTGTLIWNYQYSPTQYGYSTMGAKRTADRGFVLPGVTLIGSFEKLNLIRVDSNGQGLCGVSTPSITASTTSINASVLNDVAKNEVAVVSTRYTSVYTLPQHDSVFCYQDRYCKPTCQFSYTASNKTFQFSDETDTVTQWLWEFGDGAQSTSPNPHHTYMDTGRYEICLTVSTSCGSSTLCDTIFICETPSLNYSYQANGRTASFTNLSTAGNSLSWDFGDSIISNDPNPNHTFKDTGFHEVCLTVSTNCGSSTYCDSIYVCDNPATNFVFTTNGLDVNFTNQTPNGQAWYWDFGDSTTSSNQNPQHTFKDSGHYNVCLTVYSSCGSSTYCQTVFVCHKPNADYSYQANDLSLSFSDQSIGGQSWHWDFGDSSTSTDPSPQHTFMDTGHYEICQTVSSSCGSTTYCQTVYVCKKPIANYVYQANDLSLSFSDQSIGGQSWHWDFGDSSTSADPSPQHTFKDTGHYEICLTVSSSCGSTTYCQTVYVCKKPIANYVYQANDLSLSFSDQSTGGLSWYWDFGDSSFSTDPSPQYSFKDTGHFEVCLTVYSSCGMSSYCEMIYVCRNPFADFGYTNPSGRHIDFTNKSQYGDSWMWYFGDGDSASTRDTQHIYHQDGTYNVCLKVSNVCAVDLFCQPLSIQTSSINHFNWETIKVYPNPVETVFYVEIQEAKTDVNYKLYLYDALGKVQVRREAVHVSRVEIQCDHLAPGVYTLFLQNANGNVYRKKLVIK